MSSPTTFAFLYLSGLTSYEDFRNAVLNDTLDRDLTPAEAEIEVAIFEFEDSPRSEEDIRTFNDVLRFAIFPTYTIAWSDSEVHVHSATTADLVTA